MPAASAAPSRSAWLYARLRRADIAMFRFLLEGFDNLAYMSVVDPWSAVVRVVFSPQQEEDARAALAAMRGALAFALVERPGRSAAGQPVEAASAISGKEKAGWA